MIRSWEILSALVDLNAAVETNAEVRSAGIPIAVTRCAAGRVATGVVTPNVVPSVAQDVAPGAVIQCAVTRCAVLSVVQDVAPGVVIQNAVTLNVATLSAVLSVARDVAPGVVIQNAVTRCVRSAVDQCVANRDAMVDSEEVLPNGGQGVSRVDLLNLVAVQIEVAQDAALFSVPAPL